MSPQEKKVNPRTLRSKSWIVKSLIELMNKKPYSKITLKEICDNADLTRQTLYRNFSTKEAILEYYVDGLYNGFIKIISDKENVVLYDLLITYFEYWYKNRGFIKKLIDNNVYSILLDLHLKYLNSMATNEKLKNLTFVSSNSYFNHYAAGGLWFSLKKWIEDGVEKSPDEMANIVIDFYYMKSLNGESIKNEK